MHNTDPFYFDSRYIEKNSFRATFFNVFFAVVILVLALPIIIVVVLLIKMQNTGPVLYSGTRLGKGKTRYKMHKFRTLQVDAEGLLGSQLFSNEPNLVTPIGKFLRDTRIDELPQLINVIRGEMTLIGPRPERPAVYLDICRHITGYEKRFKVKPGLIGYSQLFTPHNTPKKIRTLIDNHYLLREDKLSTDITLLIYAMWVLLFNLFTKLPLTIGQIILLRLRKGNIEERRNSVRIHKNKAKITIWHDGEERRMPKSHGEIKNINDDHILICTPDKLTIKEFHIEIVTQYKAKFTRHSRRKCIHCDVSLIIDNGINPNTKLYEYVLSISHLSPLNTLKLNKYFLKKSIA